MRRVFLPAIVLICGCGPSVEEVVDAHRAAVSQKLDRIREVASLEDPGKPAGPPSDPLQFIPDDEGMNAIALEEEDLTDLAGFPKREFHPFLYRPWTTPAKLVEKGPGKHDIASLTEKYLSRFEGVRYVLMLKKIQYSRAVVTGFKDSKTDTFLPGRFKGELFLFDLDSGKLLLRFPVDEKHDAKFSYNVLNAKASIREHLARKVRRAIVVTLAEQVPGSKGP